MRLQICDCFVLFNYFILENESLASLGKLQKFWIKHFDDILILIKLKRKEKGHKKYGKGIMKITNEGINLKKFEGLRLEAYLCPGGVDYRIHTKGVKEGDKITQEEAENVS